MRLILSLFCMLCAGSAAAQESAQAVEQRSKPRTYALVSAIGSTLSVVNEVMSTGSHLEPYERTALTVPDDLLNHLILADLDQQVSKMDPDSQRICLSVPAVKLDGVAPSDMAQASIDAVAASLRTLPDRSEWDRIFVVTPAYRTRGRDGLGERLQGIGVFIEPLCQAGLQACQDDQPSVSGPLALRPDGSKDVASTYVAPYTFITVWELDPATLAVTNQMQIFNHQKLMGEYTQTEGIMREMDKQRVAGQVVKLLGVSIRDALRKTDLVGHVSARLLKEGEQP
ncbi:hypothetical protein ACLB1G_16500 [Oxalobacteraceae bacterium A2-2]